MFSKFKNLQSRITTKFMDIPVPQKLVSFCLVPVCCNYCQCKHRSAVLCCAEQALRGALAAGITFIKGSPSFLEGFLLL